MQSRYKKKEILETISMNYRGRGSHARGEYPTQHIMRKGTAMVK